MGYAKRLLEILRGHRYGAKVLIVIALYLGISEFYAYVNVQFGYLNPQLLPACFLVDSVWVIAAIALLLWTSKPRCERDIARFVLWYMRMFGAKEE